MEDDNRKLVDDKADNMCLVKCFLSVSSNKLHYHSKQELKNDMIKGDDNYPRDIASVLSFLQYRDLHINSHHNHTTIIPVLKETSFTQVCDEEPKKSLRKSERHMS